MNVPIPFFAASRRSSGISAPWNARALLRLSPSSRRNRLRRAPPPVDVLHVGVASARAVDMFSTALASARGDLAPSTFACARPQRSARRLATSTSTSTRFFR